ncbi:hypothetical protein M153_5940001506 [Pseudoloma neurophilia]|uniref:Uncharacterized protein n=1 Tax=Pseudoloma neurophilia TaxID=146866 RepID=A0A0R0M2Q8_9MICR|nr:hypothetical protein M153_5940001506 [Pseudoloma neurophilia]
MLINFLKSLFGLQNTTLQKKQDENSITLFKNNSLPFLMKNPFFGNSIFACNLFSNLRHINLFYILSWPIPVDSLLMTLPINKIVTVTHNKNQIRGKLIELNRHFLVLDSTNSYKYVPMEWIKKEGIEIMK